MTEFSKIKQLPTSINLTSLSDDQVIQLANDKFESVFDSVIQLAIKVKECGDCLRELKQRYSGKSEGKKSIPGKGFNQLFLGCANFAQPNLKMSRRQAYSYINVSAKWEEIEPNLYQLKQNAIRNGNISATSLLRLIDDTVQETDIPIIENTPETFVGTIKEIPIKVTEENPDTVEELKLEKAKIQQLEEHLKKDEKNNADLKRLKNTINEMKSQLDATLKENQELKNKQIVMAQPITDSSAKKQIHQLEAELEATKRQLSKVEKRKLEAPSLDNYEELQKKASEYDEQLAKIEQMKTDPNSLFRASMNNVYRNISGFIPELNPGRVTPKEFVEIITQIHILIKPYL